MPEPGATPLLRPLRGRLAWRRISGSGGVASLNRRLISATPPGSSDSWLLTMQRRDFLHPRNLLKPALDLATAVEELRHVVEDGKPEPEANAVLLRFSRRAMATIFEVILPLGTPLPGEFADAALDEIDRVEAQLTAYRETSEVCRLNERAAREPVKVEENLFQLLAQCQWLWRETGGAFDVAMGALIKCWGFFERKPRIPSADDLKNAQERSGTRHVVLDAETKVVKFQRPGLELNLGSIGKGYALDHVGGLFRREARIGNLLLQGGRSSVLALGTQPGSRQGWCIGLTDPENPQRRVGLLQLQNRGVGTSAATYLSLEHQGRRLGHILDPRSGWPAEGMLAATVTAPDATLADALATAFFIQGVEAATAFCTAHPSFGAVLFPKATYPKPVILGRAREEYRPLA